MSPGPAWQDLLDRFPVASLELLGCRALRCRTDSKFILATHAVADLLPALTSDYAVVAAGTEFLATYRTRYFDTAGLVFFDAQRRGRRVRHKVRVRHYVDRQATTFEVKTRRNELQTAKVCRARAFGDEALDALDQAFVQARTGIGVDVVPQVRTDFRRLTLVGLRSNERLTIDLDLAVRRGPLYHSFAGVAVLEVKQWPFCRGTPALAALRVAGCRPSSFSKYGAAIVLTHPGVRHNRLLPDLRALTRSAA